MESVPVATLCAFLEAAVVHPGADKDQLAEYAGKSSRTALRTLPALEELGLIERNGNGMYRSRVTGSRTGDPAAHYKQTVRKALVQHKAMEVLMAGLLVGESEEAAKRKTAVLLAQDPGLDVLIKWAIDLSLLERDERGRLRIANEVQPPSLEALGVVQSGDVSSEARARLYVAGRLGPAAAAFLDEVIWQGLVASILSLNNDPSDSMEDAGNALEDFLREVAHDQGHTAEAAKKSGASQLATLLYTEGVIHAHHMNMIQGMAAARTTQGHSKDKRTRAPWTADLQSAFWALTGVVVLMRSIHAYVYEGRQIL